MRFSRPRLSELRCMKEPYIRNMFIKNAAAFLLSIFVGVVAVIAAKTGTALLPVLFMALYFLVSAIGVAWNAAAGRYVVVRAAAVACEEQRDAVRQRLSRIARSKPFVPCESGISFFGGAASCDKYDFLKG